MPNTKKKCLPPTRVLRLLLLRVRLLRRRLLRDLLRLLRRFRRLRRRLLRLRLFLLTIRFTHLGRRLPKETKLIGRRPRSSGLYEHTCDDEKKLFTQGRDTNILIQLNFTISHSLELSRDEK